MNELHRKEQSVMLNHWRYVSGSNKYQVHFGGKVRRVYLSGKTRELTPYIRKNRGKKKWLYVHVTIGGIIKERAVHLLVAQVYEIQGSGELVMHIGSIHDNSVNNLRRVNKVELGLLTGAQSRRKPVVRTGAGESMFYTSAREAGRLNFCSYQTVNDSCNGKTKTNCTGYLFRWS